MKESIGYKKRWSFLVPQPYFDPKAKSFIWGNSKNNDLAFTKCNITYQTISYFISDHR